MRSNFPQSSNEGELGSIVAVTPRWTSAFSVREVSRLEAIAGATLGDLGYSVSNSEGDRNLGKLRLRFLHARDYLRQFCFEIMSKVTGNNRKSWHTILRLPFTALAQSRQQRF